MLDINTIDFTDFSFNGIYLSSFDCHVGGREAYKSFSALPSREITTEKLIGFDSEIVVASKLNPRTFAIPIFINELGYNNIRDLASWLDTSVPKRFYWRDDSIYINCMLDTGGLDIENIFDTRGLMELKFIAHDPFFYQITSNAFTFVDNIENLGNRKSYPLIQVNLGNLTNLTIKSFDSNNIELTSCVLTAVLGTVYIDSLEKRVYSISGQTVTNLISNFSGSFPIIDIGNIKITLSATTLINSAITPRFRWI